MGVFSYEDEAKSIIPPIRLFKQFVLDADDVVAKFAPRNGASGIKKISCYGEGYKYTKHVDEVIDHENFIYRCSIVEWARNPLREIGDEIHFEIEMVASPNGGSILKIKSKYVTKGDAFIKKEDIQAGKERAAGFHKDVEEYLSTLAKGCY